MKTLVRPAVTPRHAEDCKILLEALERLGFTASLLDIEWAYLQVSDEVFSASWLALSSWDSTEYAAKALLGYLAPDRETAGD